jgi:hypothetical protein
MKTYYTRIEHAPIAPPIFTHRTREEALKSPYVPCWVDLQGIARPLTTHGYHRYSHAVSVLERTGDERRNDPHSDQHHSRFYVWDSSVPWNPRSLMSWIPLAAKSADQYVLDRTHIVRIGGPRSGHSDNDS